MIAHERGFKALKLLLAWKLADKKQIYDLLEAKPPVCNKAVYELFHVVAAIIKLAFAGHFFTVDKVFGVDFGYFGKSC